MSIRPDDTVLRPKLAGDEVDETGRTTCHQSLGEEQKHAVEDADDTRSGARRSEISAASHDSRLICSADKIVLYSSLHQGHFNRCFLRF
jgi:hypothetical protein